MSTKKSTSKPTVSAAMRARVSKYIDDEAKLADGDAAEEKRLEREEARCEANGDTWGADYAWELRGGMDG